MEGYRVAPRVPVSAGSAPPRGASQGAPLAQYGRRHKPDYWSLLLCIGFLVIGLVVVYAISPALSASSGGSSTAYVTHQLLAVGLSIVAFAITAQLPLGMWRKLQKPLIIAALIATALAIIIPVNPQYPAHRWVRLGGLSFQSVELVKFALIIWLADLLARRRAAGTVADMKKTLQPLLIILLAGMVVVAGIQSDLGSAGVMMAIMAAMAYVAGLPIKRIMLIGSTIIIAGVLAIATTPYRRERLVAFLHPSSNCLSTGYQVCQAQIAVGSGGLIGLGLGRSVQAYGYLPEAANDSIFAIYAEKFGFIGSIILLTMFAALFTRLSKIAEHAPDLYSRLIVIGVLSWLAVQALINIGAMLGLFPLKGITLPFISYGGTSIVFMAAAVGLVFQISRYTSFTTPRETSIRRE